jgi:P27 family predicted phage terminase small subunit
MLTSWRANARPNEPEPSASTPEKPEWLGPIASEKWDEIVPELVKIGVMAVIYADFLAMYCQAHQDLHDAMELLSEEGMTCTSEKGGAYLHPAVSIKQNAIDRIAKFGREFGISPASIRGVIKTPGSEKKKTVSSRAR